MEQQLFEEIKDLFYEFGKIEPLNMESISTDNLRDEIKKLFVVALQNFDNEMFDEKVYCVKQLIRPNSLFQYRKFDANGYSLKALENNYVWLSTPSSFNDPYDCSACFDFEKMVAAIFSNNNKNSKNSKVQESIEDFKNGKSV